MTKKCVIDSLTKVVVNIIELEDGVLWSPPEGNELAPQHDGNIGDTWNGTQFVSPVEEPINEPNQV